MEHPFLSLELLPILLCLDPVGSWSFVESTPWFVSLSQVISFLGSSQIIFLTATNQVQVLITFCLIYYGSHLTSSLYISSLLILIHFNVGRLMALKYESTFFSLVFFFITIYLNYQAFFFFFFFAVWCTVFIASGEEWHKMYKSVLGIWFLRARVSVMGVSVKVSQVLNGTQDIHSTKSKNKPQLNYFLWPLKY